MALYFGGSRVKIHFGGKVCKLMRNFKTAILKGVSIFADNVLNVKHNLSIKITNKNLFNIDIVSSDRTKASVTNEGGYLRHSGATTGAGLYNINTGKSATLQELCPAIEAGKTYVISATTTCETKKYIYLQGNYNRSWVFGASLTITRPMLTDRVLFYSETGVETFISDIQIEEGETATSYVAYSQPVEGVEVTVSGKNLIDISVIGYNLSRSYVQYIEEDNTVLVQGSRTSTPGLGCGKTLQELAPSLEIGKTYTLQGESAIANRNYIYLQGYNKSWRFGNTLTITEQILTSKVLFYTNIGEDNVISNIQIALGTTITEYEPYKVQTAVTDATGVISELVAYSPISVVNTNSDNVVITCRYYAK